MTTLLAALALGYQDPTDLHVWVSRDVAPGKNIQLVINTRNLPVVEAKAYPVDALSWLSRVHKGEDRPPPIGRAVASWSVTVRQPGQQLNPTDNYFSRRVNVPMTSPGVYLLEFKAGDETASEVVNVTNLAIVNKRSQYSDLAWVTDHKNGNCIDRAELLFFSRHGTLLEKDSTAEDGARLVRTQKQPEILVVRRGRDFAAVPIPILNNDGQLNTFWQTDRPIYRPGQTVYFKAILRRTHGQGYEPEVGRPVSVSLLDPRETALDTFSFTANANGAVAGQFEIPQEGMLGAYTIDLRDQDEHTRQSISVAEYRKPEFKLDLAPQQARYLSGEKLRFNLHAGYYFGAPLPQAAVAWEARRNGLRFYAPNMADRWFYSGDGNLYPRDTYGSTPFVAEGQANTDKDGNAVIELNSDPKTGDSDYSLSVTVVDATHRQAQASTSVPVYASKLRINITPEIEAVALGGLVPVRILVTDLDGNPKPATVVLKSISDVYDSKKDIYEWRTLAQKKVRVPTSGYLREAMPALYGGELHLEADTTDDTGRSTMDEAQLWVEDPNYRPAKEIKQPTLELRLDKRLYEPGETAHAYIADNTPARPLLIVEEGLDIWRYRVASGKSIAYAMKTDLRMSPNAFLSVSQWPNHQLLEQNVIVPAPDRSKLLNVTVTPAKPEVKPGDKVSYHVETKDRWGHPVAAELCLNVVDEAIYALAPDNTGDPYQQFWGARSNRVESISSDPEEVSGGAYQRAAANSPTVRTRFEDTAYWNAFVSTDATGQTDVSFEAPGNLTTWRATARAFTPGTQVGGASTKIIASRPLTMRLALPRQMTSGDRLTVQGTINNRTANPAKVDVKLKVDGADLSGGASQTVDVPANGQTGVAWRVSTPKVPASGSATFEAQAIAQSNAPDMNDALRMRIPVYPRGYKTSASIGGSVQASATTSLHLPDDSLGEAIALHALVFKGVGAEANADAEAIVEQRYGSPAAANSLIAAAYLGSATQHENIREALAMLSRDMMQPSGWGWWEGQPTDTLITTQVAHALAVASSEGISVYSNLVDTAKEALPPKYAETQLWEYRARIAASLRELGDTKAHDMLGECLSQGINMSPFARLRLVQGLLVDQQASSADATKELESVLTLVSRGSGSSYLPVGEGIGWTASSVQSTALLLQVLVQTNLDPELQSELVQWLVSSDDAREGSGEEMAQVVEALGAYLKKHPENGRLGPVSITVDGVEYQLKPSTVDDSASVNAYNVPLHPGSNPVSITRTGDGVALYKLATDFFRPADNESHVGLRVARRFEVRNAAGIWTEVDRVIKPGEPVRVTISVWGDDIPDAVRVDEPLPAGFEFVDSDLNYRAREEVRDRAVVHYLANAGTPTVFRYYIRAEAGGKIVAPPASGQYLRRPLVLGHGATQPLEVSDK